MGIRKGSLASKPKFLIPLQHCWDREIPLCSFQSARGAVLPIPRGSCFSGLSAMRGEKGEVILERYRMLLTLSTSNIPRCPAQGSMSQEASLGSAPPPPTPPPLRTEARVYHSRPVVCTCPPDPRSYLLCSPSPHPLPSLTTGWMS